MAALCDDAPVDEGEDLTGLTAPILPGAVGGGDIPPQNGKVCLAELMDGSVRREWFVKSKQLEREAEGRAGLLSSDGGPRLPESRFSAKPWAFACWLPLPDEELLDKIEAEVLSRGREGPLGPLASEYRERVLEWAWLLRLKFRGTSRRVCGSWRKLGEHWRTLLRVLPRRLRRRAQDIVTKRARLPWNEMPPGPVRCPRTGGCPANHPDLWKEKDKFWETLEEQLIEGAVRPWDVKGRDDVDALPMGMFPVRWVVKPGSSKVRITVNMRGLNGWLNKNYCSVELPSVRKNRLFNLQDDWKSGLDMHSSFFHGENDEGDVTWQGFSVCDDELPAEAVEHLWRYYPECRWRGRWVFVYVSFAMGCSASVSAFQCVTSTAVMAMEESGVGGAYGLPMEQWRSSVFIDDESANSRGGPRVGLRNGSGFGNALELSLRLLATFLWLGTDINFEKSQLIPRRDAIFLGIGHDTSLMRFFLSIKRCAKLRQATRRLRSQVTVGELVLAIEVARLVGTLYSVAVVCRRAVALMTRGMIRILAKMLNAPWLVRAAARGVLDLKWLLRAAWRGSGIWTVEGNGDLCFWEIVPWEELWAPMGYDVFDEAVLRSVAVAARDELASDVMVVASDASDVAVGGGVFVPVGGRFEVAQQFHHTLERPDGSSAVRECEGVVKTTVAADPARGSRVLPVVDNQPVWRVLRQGSGVPELQEIARWFFLWCLHREVASHPVWQPRDAGIIDFCDGGSRLHDRHDFSCHPALFWEANVVARRVWGRGFTYDRFASFAHVQPVDCSLKLPFTSRFRQACSSGADALSEDWRREVNWVNAPFALLGKVWHLLRVQRCVAAVVVPRGSCAWWARSFSLRSEGVVSRLNFEGGDPRSWPGAGGDAAPRCATGLAVVFVDFRRRGDACGWRKGWSAEGLLEEWRRLGSPRAPTRYARVDGTLVLGPPGPNL